VGNLTIDRLCAAVLFFAAAAAAFAAGPPVSVPALGDTYVYRLVDGYNGEVRGRLVSRVETAGSQGVVMAVTAGAPAPEAVHTEAYAADGNWLRHPMESHGRLVHYEFNPPYPAYRFPLNPGKVWSERVGATIAALGRSTSVRVDGEVLGNDRVRVPAGEFDTIRVRRLVYPGDQEHFLAETRIVETDWYAPALGRPVRTERRSEWFDRSRPRNRTFYGDWTITELVEFAPAQR
jgi:hypothetical protein